MGAFGLLPGNNAPLPSFTQGTNPTGGASKGGNVNFPNYPMFGPTSSPGGVSPMVNAPLFSASGMSGLSSGMKFPGWGNDPSGHLLNELGSAYGKGAGSYIDQILMHGLFNPQVASAYLNAMQPSINRGQANLLNSFGSEGSRFSSTAAFGLGDYLSQTNLNEQQTLASMYLDAQHEQMSLLQNVIPTLHAEQANKGGFWHDILGGLEIAGGIATEVFAPGNPIGIGLIGSGVGTLAGGLDSGGGSSGGGGNPLAGVNTGMTTPPFFPNGGQNIPTQQANQSFWQQYGLQDLSASGGNALTGDTSGSNDLSEFLAMGVH